MNKHKIKYSVVLLLCLLFLVSVDIHAANVVKVTKDIKCVNSMQYGIIRGKSSSGNTLWTYKTSKCFAAGPAATNMLYDDKYVYIINRTTYIRLAKQTGKVLVKKEITCMSGWGTAMYLDSEGNLYAINKYDKYFVKINKSGKVVWKHRVKNGNYFISLIIKEGKYLYLISSYDEMNPEKVNIKTGR